MYAAIIILCLVGTLGCVLGVVWAVNEIGVERQSRQKPARWYPTHNYKKGGGTIIFLIVLAVIAWLIFFR